MGLKTYRVGIVVSCILVATHLRDTNHLRRVLRQALQVFVREPRLRDHFMSLLDKDRSVPSPTTLYCHRLTFQMGDCGFAQDVHDNLLQPPGGCTRWMAVGGSPQSGIEWVLAGSATMKQQGLVPALALAEELATG